MFTDFILLLLLLQYRDEFEMDLNMNEILVNDCTDGLKVTNQQPYQRDKKKQFKTQNISYNNVVLKQFLIGSLQHF